jgi:hypothetical protein
MQAAASDEDEKPLKETLASDQISLHVPWKLARFIFISLDLTIIIYPKNAEKSRRQ